MNFNIMNSEIPSLKNDEYRNIIENLIGPFSLMYVADSGHFDRENVYMLDINPAYEKVMKVSKANVIGRKFYDIWPKGEKKWMDNIMNVDRTGQPAYYHGYSREVDKYLHAVAFSIEPKKVGVLFWDITGSEQLKSELDESKGQLLQYRNDLRRLLTSLTLAEEKVRKEIAGEIHDHIGYGQTEILARLKNIRSSLPDNAPQQAQLSETIAQLSDLISSTKSMIFNFSSPVLYQVGLGAALMKLGESFFTPRDIAFDYSGPISDQGIPYGTTVLLFQFARELFMNIWKHAEADNAFCRLKCNGKQVTLIVEDNGIGIPDNNNPQLQNVPSANGIGLFSIKEKIRYLNGNFEVLAAPDKGTMFVITVPYIEKQPLGGENG